MHPLRPLSLLLAVIAAGGRLLAAEPARTTRSVSGQFIITASEQAMPSAAIAHNARGLGLVQLAPTLTAVSCERVKTAVLRQFKMSDAWKGRVTVLIVPATVADQNPAITATLFRDGWYYRLELPSEVKVERFVRAVVQVVLLEIANRRAGENSAEIPRWLGEGMTQHILASEPDVLLHAAQLLHPAGSPDGVRRELRAPDSLARARKTLAERPALTFDELSWPTPEHARGERLQLYQHSAQAFVHYLLRLNQGEVALRDFLTLLPANLNWQTSFLRAFKPHFGMLLDVEKWWAVCIASFTGRNQWQMWPPEVAIEKLDVALLAEVETRANPEAAPVRSSVRLQIALTEWDVYRQRIAMEMALNRLNSLRHNVPPELITVVDEYRVALETYLGKREKMESAGKLRGQVIPSTKIIATEAARRLDALDARRDMWRQEFTAAAADRTGPGSVP